MIGSLSSALDCFKTTTTMTPTRCAQNTTVSWGNKIKRKRREYDWDTWREFDHLRPMQHLFPRYGANEFKSNMASSTEPTSTLLSGPLNRGIWPGMNWDGYYCDSGVAEVHSLSITSPHHHSSNPREATLLSLVDSSGPELIGNRYHDMHSKKNECRDQSTIPSPSPLPCSNARSADIPTEMQQNKQSLPDASFIPGHVFSSEPRQRPLKLPR